ncbi:MAG: hypothetical protein B6229_03270 [Spirochaetaceae bacterium 4572_7]|nr:MAG: hypothetical protein B6229_03270 [Spirochaetaceae bacterium 4572_7]
MIEIKCKAAAELSLDDLSNFQGGLKTIKEENLMKLKNSIKVQGFIAPIFVWNNDDENWILDGHQRLKALKSLEDDGEIIPPLPVAYIEADDIKEAKEKLLHITSQHGDFTIDGLDGFLMDAELDLDTIGEVRLLDTELVYPPDGLFKVDFEQDIQDEYKEPEKKKLVCPKCGHIDSAERFQVNK